MQKCSKRAGYISHIGLPAVTMLSQCAETVQSLATLPGGLYSDGEILTYYGMFQDSMWMSVNSSFSYSHCG